MSEPIAYLPNDPGAALPLRTAHWVPHLGGSAGYDFVDDDPLPGVYASLLRSFRNGDFNHWQCIHSAHTALSAWEALFGTLPRWRGNSTRLSIEPEWGSGLDAGYDRSRLLFLRGAHQGQTVFAGSSVDIVAHEVGHALLDALNDKLFATNLSQVNAFHEAFGDIFAIYTSIQDPAVQSALQQADSDLSTHNFLQRVGEDLFTANGHGARNSLNTKSPSASASLRDLTEVMSGCWYDTLRLRFATRRSNMPWKAAILRAASEALEVLVAAARDVLPVSEFFREIGWRMRAAAPSPRFAEQVTAAFGGHGVHISDLEDIVALSAAPPSLDSLGRPVVSAATRSEVATQLGVSPTKLRASADLLTGEVTIASTISPKLGRLSDGLAGITASAQQWGSLRNESGTAVLVLHDPCPEGLKASVHNYVRLLLQDGRIRDVHSSRAATTADLHSHRIDRRGRPQLRRLRFACFGR